MRHLIKLALIVMLLPLAAQAKSVAYKVNNANSDVAFLYDFEGAQINGSFPDFTADVALDFDRLENSQIDVRLQTRTTKGGFVFATQAVRGPKMLDAASYPTITFKSTRLVRSGDQARLIGNITVKNVTRPLTLNARIFRTAGSDPADRDTLVVKLTGQINRSEFGVDGFKSYVGDVLKITITTQISKQ